MGMPFQTTVLTMHNAQCEAEDDIVDKIFVKYPSLQRQEIKSSPSFLVRTRRALTLSWMLILDRKGRDQVLGICYMAWGNMFVFFFGLQAQP